MDFLHELARLMKETPKHHLPMQDCENCPYNSFLYKSRDCYLCFSSSLLESCFFISNSAYDKDCADSDFINHCELCYECLDCENCYNCTYCQDCKNCTDSAFCYDCQGATNCFGCVGLRKKEFHIFNKKYSREDYFAKVEELKNSPHSKILEEVGRLRLRYGHPPLRIVNSENCFGDYLINSKNCYMVFNAENCVDSGYLYDEMYNIKDCFDCTHIHNSELCYNLMSANNCYNVDSSWWMTDCRDCSYCACNQACTNCFGCVYLQRKEFYILNKPYAKEAYFKKVAEIKDQLRDQNLAGKYLIMEAAEMIQRL